MVKWTGNNEFRVNAIDGSVQFLAVLPYREGGGGGEWAIEQIGLLLLAITDSVHDRSEFEFF